MIAIPSGWSVEQLPNALALTHPAGRDTARVFYRERAGRPQRIGALASAIMAGWPALALRSIGPVERLHTEEGELAAMLTLACTEAGHEVHVNLGFVFTDEFVTSIAALCRDPARRSEITELAYDLLRRENLALGVRRRQFEYQPPAGWQPLRQGLATEWIPPGYPRHGSSVMVYPASPIQVAGRAQLGDALPFLAGLGWELIASTSIGVGRNRHGVPFEAHDVRFQRGADQRATRIVLLSDPVYQYPIELRTQGSAETEADRQVLAELADSVIAFCPVVSASTMQHWIE